MTPDDLVHRLAKAITDLAAAITKVVHQFGDWFRELTHKLRPIRDAIARDRWQQAQRNARTLSRHPDLVAADRWLDRMYDHPIAAPPLRFTTDLELAAIINHQLKFHGLA